jgi:hypothetical protein
MKKSILSFTAIVFALTCSAQMLTPTVISSTGGFSSNANGSISYTVGEMTMVQTFSSGSNILTQGFQQPNDNILGLIDISAEDFGSFVVYPNPAVDNVWYGFQFPEPGKISVSVYNTLGQKISDVYHAGYDTGKDVQQLNVSAYAAGVYFLTVDFTSQKDGKTHVISKKFQVIN